MTTLTLPPVGRRALPRERHLISTFDLRHHDLIDRSSAGFRLVSNESWNGGKDGDQ
jgi:hypothetical protein